MAFISEWLFPLKKIWSLASRLTGRHQLIFVRHAAVWLAINFFLSSVPCCGRNLFLSISAIETLRPHLKS